MKQLKIIFIFLLSINLLFGFATFSTAVNANSLAAKIQGKGITITNPRITRGRIGGGNSQVATFSNGISGANLSIDEGILLTASTANEAFSTNNSGRRSRNPGNINNIGGLPTYDPDLLGTILQTTIFNQVIFEFDVTLDDNTRLLLVDYQFASDEYPEWVGTQFNDAFGFFVSGGDLTQTYNIARVVDDSIIVTTANIASYKPVNVNNVNDGTLGNRTGTYGVFANDLTNSQFYIDNGGTDVGNGGVDTTKALIISEFDGFTTKLHATLDNLTPGQTYHFKMALADTSDASWDAGVFINKIIGVRVPSVCYDYDVRVGATVYPSNDNREINVTAFPGEQLNLGIAIQSEEGEISLEESNLSVILNPNNNFNFIDASISPDSINSYLPVPDAWVEKVPNAVIPTGENITAAGGTIQTNQVIFNNLNYELNSTTNNAYTNFDLNLSVTLNLNGILIRRSASTIDGSLTRCDGQNGYGPQWAYLNVEKRDSQLAVGNARYLLDTQISGKPFDIDIASYKITDPSDPEILENFTVELEMIDAGKYSNSEQSLFTCREPSSISTGVMVPFPLGNAQTRVPVNGFVTSNAIRNSAFRLWYLTDGNNTAINYTCAIYDDNTCYKPLYTANYASKSPLRCQTECTSGTGCYQCLKNFYAKPICSRDNFSVRPASYRLEIKDNNQSNDPTFLQTSAGLNNTLTPLKLAAGYKYILNGFATRYDTDTIANGYSQTFKDETDSNYISQFLFNDAATCPDNTSQNIGIAFRDGAIKYIYSGSYQFNALPQYLYNNVGQYIYQIRDNNWTIVDQRRYPLKTFPGYDDCVVNNSSIPNNGQVGCTISSNTNIPLYEHDDMNFNFKPYVYDLNQTSLVRTGNNGASWVYMNDLSKSTQMAVKIEGNITALGADGGTLSNYITGCAADNVILSVDRSMTPNETTITTTNGTPIRFQQVIKDNASTFTLLDNSSGTDMNSSLTAANFLNNGDAAVDLYFNFAKDYNETINPIDVNFSMIHASSPNAQSYANQKTNYIPDGNKTINTSLWFLFAKVAPKLGDEYIITYDSNYTTSLRVDTFCQNVLGIVNCNMLQVSNILGANEENINGGLNGAWYRASPHVRLIDGNVTTLTGDVGGIIELPLNAVTFDNNGSTSNRTLTYPLANARPKDVVLTITPDEWLKYDKNNVGGLPTFSIHYLLQGLKWKGEGDTGHVINTTPYSGKYKRMNW